VRAHRSPATGLPPWLTWVLAVPGLLAVIAALVDYGDAPAGNFPLRARMGVLGLALLLMAWLTFNSRTRRPRRLPTHTPPGATPRHQRESSRRPR